MGINGQKHLLLLKVWGQFSSCLVRFLSLRFRHFDRTMCLCKAHGSNQPTTYLVYTTVDTVSSAMVHRNVIKVATDCLIRGLHSPSHMKFGLEVALATTFMANSFLCQTIKGPQMSLLKAYLHLCTVTNSIVQGGRVEIQYKRVLVKIWLLCKRLENREMNGKKVK